MKSLDKNSRSMALDCIRIIAVLFVIMIHTAMRFVNFDSGSPAYLCGNIFDALARPGVPLFIMVSGALLLDENKEITIKTLFLKYLLNVVLLFAAWSFIYTSVEIATMVFKGQDIALWTVMDNLLSGGFHMWYLLMVMGLYLAIPVLKLFVRKEHSGKILYIIIVSMFFCFLPILLKSFSTSNAWILLARKQIASLRFEFIGVVLAYFLTGWYVFHVGVKHKKTVCALAVISAALIIVLVQLTGNYDGFYAYDNILVYLYALGIFTFVCDVCKGKTSPKIIGKLSNLTFGVYILHAMILTVVNLFFDKIPFTAWTILIRFGLVTILSLAASFILSKIPGLRKLVRF